MHCPLACSRWSLSLSRPRLSRPSSEMRVLDVVGSRGVPSATSAPSASDLVTRGGYLLLNGSFIQFVMSRCCHRIFFVRAHCPPRELASTGWHHQALPPSWGGTPPAGPNLRHFRAAACSPTDGHPCGVLGGLTNESSASELLCLSNGLVTASPHAGLTRACFSNFRKHSFVRSQN